MLFIIVEISFFEKKPAQNREKSTNGDYYLFGHRYLSGSQMVYYSEHLKSPLHF